MDSLALLAMIWAGVFAANMAARWTRLTPVVWFLAVGAILGNSGLLPAGDAFVEGLSALGIILIMFAIGFEESTDNFLDSLKKSWGIALFGAIAPFAAAYTVADWLWRDFAVSLMAGLTMTATAVSLTMISLKSEGLAGSPVATRIMTSAVLDDIASLALVAIIVPVAAGKGEFSLAGLAATLLKAVGFFAIVAAVGGWLFGNPRSRFMRHLPNLGGRSIRKFIDVSRHSTLAVLLIALLTGLLAHGFGLHPAIGAYMAGLILREEFFLLVDTHGSFRDTKRIIDNAAFSWLGPVFFIALGGRVVIDADIVATVAPYVAVMFTAIFCAQVSSAALAARFTGAMDWRQSLMIGFGMLGRAELAFVVLDIAYVQNRIIPEAAFHTLMATAMALNIAVPVTISFWKPYLHDQSSPGSDKAPT